MNLKFEFKVDIDSRLGKSVVITKNTPQVNSNFLSPKDTRILITDFTMRIFPGRDWWLLLQCL